MSHFLALDASTEVCSVAINNRQGETLSRMCEQPRSHAKVLLPMVDELLAETGISLQELDAIGVTSGPGSFTGIRIGLGIAQGLAYGAQVPLLGIDTLSVLVRTFHGQQPDNLPENYTLVPALDARMSEVYWSGWECNKNGARLCHKARVESPQQMLASLEASVQRGVIGVGHGWLVTDSSGLGRAEPGLKPHASALLSLLAEEFPRRQAELAGQTLLEQVALEPVYLRNEISWEKRKRIRQDR